jgi:predicted permease
VSTPRVEPPRWADRLLERVLPPGAHGLSIIADLHLELDDLVRSRRVRFPRLWYAWEALRLAGRYVALRVGRRWTHGRRGPTREEMMATLWTDVLYAVRMLWKTPGLSAVAILTIALGVGFTTHTYSTVYGSVVRGLPVPDEGSLVNLDESIEPRGIASTEVPLHDFLDLRAEQTVFEDLAAFYQGTVNLAGSDAPPERFAGAFVTANMFDVVGVPPLMGRTFREGEDAFDSPPRIVLSYHTWQNRFNGDPSIVGRTIRANGAATEIIGVMPEGFAFPFRESVWLTHRMNPAELERRGGQDLDLVARLGPEVTLDIARAELDAIASRLENLYPEHNAGVRFGIRPFAERFMPRQITTVLWVMLAATFGVLLIACANVANLLLARASVRAREVAIRTAMGASRRRVIQQLLVEAAVVAGLGGLLGLGLAYVGVDIFNQALAGIERPYWIDIRVDPPALLFALGVTALASLAAGTIPAWRASGLGLGDFLKDEGRGTSSLRLGRLSTALVVGEIAVSCSLLVAAGLMIKSVANLRTLDLGFEPSTVLTGRVGLFEADYPRRVDREQFLRELEVRLEAEPGVVDAALATSLPALGAARWVVEVEGDSYLQDRDYPVVNGSVITDGFFTTLGVPLQRGRDFAPGEVWDASDPPAIVNESFASRVLGDRDPVGARIRLGGSGSELPWMTVVGVVPDLHVGGGVGGIGDDLIDPEHLYVPPAILDVRFMSALVRTQGPPTAMAPRLREIVTEIDPDLPVYWLGGMDDAVEQSTWAFGLFGSLFTIFGIAALFMAAVGLYGVMSFSVSQRRQEIGVRMALGAGPERILRMVLRRGLLQLGIGMTLGMALGYGLTRPMRVVTFDVDVVDPTVYGAILITLALAGLMATLVPARTATRADPVEAMRPE